VKRTLFLALAAGLLASTPVRAANPVVEIDTSLGKIKVELDPDKAPVTVKNFLSYVDDKFYDGTIFHRVIGRGSPKMVQGGGMEPGGKQKETKAPIKLESGNGLSNKRGTIAMARTGIPDSATAQFYINHQDNLYLDRAPGNDGYAVFGKVTDGMDVVDKIAAVKTGARDVPTTDVVIKSIRRVEK
jgi:cyclophilin family peptidyl-prolyl cis-trans isomerase